MRTNISLMPVVLTASVLMGCGSSSPVVTSSAPVAAIAVDGQIDDWDASIRKIDKQSFSMGIKNDSEFLYVSLVTIDGNVVSQVMRSGLDIWFDPNGGRDKVFGIRFPIGHLAGGPSGTESRQRIRQGRTAEEAREAMEKAFAASLSQLQVLYNGEAGLVLPSEGIPGVEIKSTLSLGTLTYELRIPLQTTDRHQYAVGAAAGATIGIGLETPRVDKGGVLEGMEERGDGDVMGGGGIGGGGMRSGGTRGGGRRDGGLRQNEGLKYWARVAMAD